MFLAAYSAGMEFNKARIGEMEEFLGGSSRLKQAHL